MESTAAVEAVGGAHHRNPELVIRAVRWVAAAVTALQFVPGGSVPGGPSWGWGALLAGGFLLVSLASKVAHGARPRLGDSGWPGWVELAADTLLALALVWLFRHDPGAPAWAVLVLPVVEGSVRARLPGAVGTFVVVAAVFAGVQASGPADLQRALLVVCLMAMVALACGLLAENLGQEMESQRRARVEAARRAQLLATVAAAARQLTTLDAEQVLAGIVDSAIELGFDCAEMCVLTEGGRQWRATHPRGLPERHRGEIQPVGAGVAGLVYECRAAVELEDYSTWEHALPTLRAQGLRGVFAAPVWSGGEIAAVLTAATSRQAPLSDSEREAVELLASQASRALENAHRYAEREQLQQQLTHQAFHDTLTGLPNRALLRDRLVQTIARARRDAASLAVMFLDLDGFKRVNDRSGHHAGDELLVTVAARLGLCVRPGDTVARFGGDEFTILLERVDGVDDVLAVARRVLHALTEPVTIGDQQFSVSASVGIACADAADGVPDPDVLLQQADRAMYLAKERGKGLVKVYDAQAERRHEEFLTLDGQLRRGIAAGEVRVYYQPIARAGDLGIEAIEALARWHHPERGLVPPSVFVPMAERSGSVMDLGQRVLDQATRAAMSVAVPRLCVNVSMSELRHPAFRAGVERCLERTGFDPARLVLELGLNATDHDEQAALRRSLAGLRGLGVGIAVDDFGRGDCSLRALRELPVDDLKIDRCLVAGILHTSEDRAIVRWTVEVAHELDMRVTAVGVETLEQLRCLRELGCDLVQGFLFQAPRPLDEVEPLLRAGTLEPHEARPRAAGVPPT